MVLFVVGTLFEKKAEKKANFLSIGQNNVTYFIFLYLVKCFFGQG